MPPLAANACSSPTISTVDQRKTMRMMPPRGPRSAASSPAASPVSSPRVLVQHRKQQQQQTSPPPIVHSSLRPREVKPAANNNSTTSVPYSPPSSPSGETLNRANGNNNNNSNNIDPIVAQLERAVQTSTPRAMASLYNQLGNAYFRRGNMEAAMKAYQQAVEIAEGPHLVSALSNLATCHWKSHDCDRAIQLLERALQVLELDLQQRNNNNPSSTSMDENLQAASIFHQLGVCYCLENDFTKALERLEAARRIRVRQNIDVAPTLDAMGKVFLLQNKFEPALQCHQEALQISYTASTLVSIARVHHAAGQLAEAIAWLEQAWQQQQTTTGSSSTPAQQQQRQTTLQFLVQLYEEAGNLEAAAQYRAELR